MKYKHSQKQNQCILQCTDSTLVVGADVAKKTQVARAVDFRGIELGKDCVFSNDHVGLTKQVQWMKELQRVQQKQHCFWYRTYRTLLVPDGRISSTRGH